MKTQQNQQYFNENTRPQTPLIELTDTQNSRSQITLTCPKDFLEQNRKELDQKKPEQVNLNYYFSFEGVKQKLKESAEIASSLVQSSQTRSRAQTIHSQTAFPERAEQTRVRPAANIKNPFSLIRNLKGESVSSDRLCQTEEDCVLIQTTNSFISPKPCQVLNTQIYEDKEIEEEECHRNTEKFCPGCIEEQRKHQITKRALDKAIQLANTLMDQL